MRSTGLCPGWTFRPGPDCQSLTGGARWSDYGGRDGSGATLGVKAGTAAFLGLSCAVATGVSAQSVRVNVREAGTNMNVEGAVVSLLTTRDTSLVTHFTNPSGNTVLQWNSAGRYRVRARRVGYTPVYADVTLSAGISEISLSLPRTRQTLSAIVVQSDSACGDYGAQNGAVYRIWEQVQAALEANRVTEADELVRMEVESYERTLDLRLAERAKRLSVKETATKQPFAAANPSDLARGYVKASAGSSIYYAPDARTLLSDEFASRHCFFVRDNGAPGREFIGLGFTPRPGISTPDVSGVLWVDRKTQALNYLEYTYQNVMSSIPLKGVGGRIEFTQLPSGEWIIPSWYIRTPRVARVTRAVGYARRVEEADTLIGFRETGATARVLAATEHARIIKDTVVTADAVEQLAPTEARQKPVASLSGRVFAEGGSKIPVAGVEVSVDGFIATTDTTGTFRVNVPPGPHAISVRRLGYLPQTFMRGFTDGEQATAEYILAAAPVALDTVSVKAAAPGGHMLDEMNARRQRGIGVFLSRAQIERGSKTTLAEALQAISGLKVVRMNNGDAAVANARPLDRAAMPLNREDQRRGAQMACYSQVYVAGMRVYAPGGGLPLFNINTIASDAVEAVEFFRGPAETPAQFEKTDNPCGTLMIWLRTN